jgi:site-specific recombinase XerD
VKVKGSFHWRELAMAQLELAKLAKHYAQSNDAEGKETRTIEGYSYTLSLYTRYLSATGIPAELSAFTLNSVRDFVLHEQGRGMSPNTVQDEVRGLKAFASRLAREDYTPENVLARIPLSLIRTVPHFSLTTISISGFSPEDIFEPLNLLSKASTAF